MKCLLGKLRTRVSVFSGGGMLGGQAIDTLVETWPGMVAKFGIDTREKRRSRHNLQRIVAQLKAPRVLET